MTCATLTHSMIGCCWSAFAACPLVVDRWRESKLALPVGRQFRYALTLPQYLRLRKVVRRVWAPRQYLKRCRACLSTMKFRGDNDAFHEAMRGGATRAPLTLDICVSGSCTTKRTHGIYLDPSGFHYIHHVFVLNRSKACWR